MDILLVKKMSQIKILDKLVDHIEKLEGKCENLVSLYQSPYSYSQ